MSSLAPQRFAYVEADPLLGPASALPYAPITLRLGAVREEQVVPVRLGGNLAESEARGLILIGQIQGFPPVRLAFAWSQSNRIPVMLGQTNFFLEFDVRFCRSQMFFEVAPRSSAG